MIGGSDEELEVLATALRVLERTYVDRGVEVPAAVVRCREQLRADWSRQEPTFVREGLRPGDGACVGDVGPSEPSLVLTYEEAAAALRVSTRTVERLVEKGELLSIRISDRITRVQRSDLDEYLKHRQRESA